MSQLAVEPSLPAPAPSRRGLLSLSLIAVVVFAVTAIPYAMAYTRASSNLVFGDVLVWPEDQDMYYSFIRQASDGHFLFVNRLTSVEHEPAFVNLEWWLIGRLVPLSSGSTGLAYQIWRGAGALAVVFGFGALIHLLLHDPWQRRVALLMGVFGGALKVACLVVSRLGRGWETLTGWPTSFTPPDFPYFATHPYGQILVNPHFSLPLGLFLLAMAAYVKGEQTGAWRWYSVSGFLAAIEGNMRPYDMIALGIIIPAFVVLEAIVARRVEWNKVLHRILPLLMVAPVLLYTAYLFSIHPVFRYWASQGASLELPWLMTVLYIGLAGGLFALRICLWKHYPLNSSSERLVLAWLVSVVTVVHAYRLPLLRMPFSPQLLTILLPPVVLLGVVVIEPQRWFRGRLGLAWGTSLVAGFVFVNSLDSLALLYWLTPEADKPSQLYLAANEVDAYAWLGREAVANDVVLASRQTGHRVAKYASVRVVSGHWSVTPQSRKIEARIRSFYANEMSPHDALEFLKDHRVDWIYVGAAERKLGDPHIDLIPGTTKHGVNADVTIYRFRPESGTD